MKVRAAALAIAGPIGLMLFAAACGGGDEAPSSEPGPAAAVTSSQDFGDVAVFVTEYTIDMPAILDAGEIEISVTNQGVEDHNLLITLKGEEAIVWQTDGIVEPNSTETAVVELEPGVYMVVCTFAGHDTRGMFMEVEVRSDDR
ncbi:MAG: sulfocyanin-like copper-binding protein [Gemmatimonadota bacterium]|nr:sulfocyanin-like copper-binding protein [Gemmatimonadota bacterium]